MRRFFVPAILSLVALALVPGCDGLIPWTPNKPVITDGPNTGLVDLVYSFKTTCNAAAGQQVSYRFDWGDGDTSDWSAPFAGTAGFEATKFWGTEGTYQVRSQAKGTEESEWSEPHEVVIVDSGPQYPHKVLATIMVEAEPSDVVVADTAHPEYLYVSSRGENRVVVVHRDSGTVVAEVPVAGEPRGMAVHPVRDELFVACGEGAVVGLTIPDHQEFVRVGIEGMLFDVDCTPDGSFLYVTDAVQNKVHIIETGQQQVVSEVEVGMMPHGVVVVPGGEHAYVANNGSDSVTVLNVAENRVVRTVAVGQGPYWLAADLGGDRVYVALSMGNEVKVVQTSDHTVERTVSVGNLPHGVGVLPGGSFYFVSNNADNTVSVVRAADDRVMRTIDVGHGPTAVRVSADGRYVYICNTIANSVTVLGY